MQERDLFIAALEIDDAAARRAYLDVACEADPALRDRVERLLNRSLGAGDFLEKPAADLCTDHSAAVLTANSEPSHGENDPPTLAGEADDTGRTVLGKLAGVAAPGSQDASSGQRKLDQEALALGVMFGRYQVERVLGSGGMGVVYLAVDLRLGRRVALKIPKFDADGALHLSQRFRREARTMASVVHRNLCPIFDVNEQDGTHYLTMAFIDGEPLSQIIKQGASFTTRQIAELIRKLALALDVAHRAGIVHRDLKPANVMIDRSGEPILLDFGLAWMAHESDARVTQSGAIMGTPAYMSPEQAEGDPNMVGPASDIYSLGAILYELLAGRPVHTGGVTRVLFKLVHDVPARPGESRNDVDPKLEAICWQAISRRPEDRFASAAEFAEALAGFLADHRERASVVEQPPHPQPLAPEYGGEGSHTLKQVGSGSAEAQSSHDSHHSHDEVNISDQTEVLRRVVGTEPVGGVKWQVLSRGKPQVAIAGLLLFGLVAVLWTMFGKNQAVEKSNPVVTVPLKPATPETPAAPAQPPVPVDVGRPFVIVRDGKDVRTFKTLVAAIEEMMPDDIVEIRSNFRLPVKLTEPVSKPLTIRAGTGYRPLLAFVGPSRSLRIVEDFSVEGCDLDFRSRSFDNADLESTWRIHRCRLWGDPPGGIPKMRFTETVFISIWGIPPAIHGAATDYEFDTCLVRNHNVLMNYLGNTGNHVLRLRNCTFHVVSGHRSHIANLTKDARLTVEATGNVFHCQSQAKELIEPKSMSKVTWIGTDNCFSGTWYQIWDGSILKEKGLPAWNKLWKAPERNSREVDFLAFEWGRIQRLPNPERFNAIRAAAENMILQHKLPEAGPDWELIGPGAAYVRALAAEGRTVPESELRPERREDGPIVLLRAGKEVRGYLTLKPALDAAQDKDVIELRTDGLVKDNRWTGVSRLLTIRAGAGYTPLIDASLGSNGTDRLILEGLTIQHVVQASGGVAAREPWDDQHPLFPTQGSIVRMMNCTLLPESGKSVVDARLFGDGSAIPEIVNCNLGMLRIGIPSGGTARLRNSVLADCRPNVDGRNPQPGRLEIERCLFWLPEPAINVWSASVMAHSSITIQAQRSIFVSPVDLAWANSHPIGWTGTGNVFMKAHGFSFSKVPLPFRLEQFQTERQTEAGSIELPPWEFDPAQWRILRDKSPGYQPRPDGTDYGADIDRLVQAIDLQAAPPEAK